MKICCLPTRRTNSLSNQCMRTMNRSKSRRRKTTKNSSRKITQLQKMTKLKTITLYRQKHAREWHHFCRSNKMLHRSTFTKMTSFSQLTTDNNIRLPISSPKSLTQKEIFFCQGTQSKWTIATSLWLIRTIRGQFLMEKTQYIEEIFLQLIRGTLLDSRSTKTLEFLFVDLELQAAETPTSTSRRTLWASAVHS